MYDNELLDDFYEIYEETLEEDGITAEEASFMRGYMQE
jgi:lipid II:glycine glycyltransferase (peptidoglycan interpeptide bridge formation enzyme)